LVAILIKACRNRKQNSRFLPIIIPAFLFTFNFGIPWILYIFYIHEYYLPYFSYIFILVNGTQGMVLFGQQWYFYWVNSKRRRSVMRSFSNLTKSESCIN